MIIETSAALRAWAKRMQLRPGSAARALGLTVAGYRAQVESRRNSVNERISLLADVYEDDPRRMESILARRDRERSGGIRS